MMQPIAAHPSIQQELLELLILLQHLNPAQVKALCQFVQGSNTQANNQVEAWLFQLTPLIQKCNPDQIDKLVAFSKQPDDDPQIRKDIEVLAHEVSIPMKDFEAASSTLISLHQLQRLLQNLSILQLMKLFEVMPPGPPIQQLQILQQIQQLFGSLQPATLENIHHQVEEAQPGTEQETFSKLLELPNEYFHLYQPLRILLQLDIEELMKLQEVMPRLQPVQILQLLQLLQLQPFDVLELRNLLNPHDSFPAAEMTMEEMENPPSISQTLIPANNTNTSDKKLTLQIVEQPPEKSVYKRNLKPNPMVMINGDSKINDGNLYVAPVLVRCDTFTEENKYLTGNKPVKVASGRVMTFRKLKITTTSHQQQETLFCLKFELRRYSGEDEYEVLEVIHTNPICVLSHSTQMKPVPSVAPVITEVIPAYGPPSGGTRVAILGTNFVDNPAARIRFDQTDVMPMFHGPGTLLCHTPQHPPGTVQVRVCNSVKKWSDQFANFTYDEKLASFNDAIQVSALSKYAQGDINNPSNGGGSITRSAWEGSSDEVQQLHQQGASLDQVDSRGYAVLHYASALGYSPICSYVLENGGNADVLDKYDCTPLFWACVFGQLDIAQALVEHGCELNYPCTPLGITPLLAAVLQDQQEVAAFLLESGASLNDSALSGESPLHMASALGSYTLVKLLVQYGSFLNAVDEDLETPLHYAVREGRTDIVSLLLEQGAVVDPLNEDGETPLYLACQFAEEPIVNLLLRKGANVNGISGNFTGTPQKNPGTPLHEASKIGHQAIVRMLAEMGAELDVKDEDGQTPLSLARAIGSGPLVQYLSGLDSFKKSAPSSASSPSQLQQHTAVYAPEKYTHGFSYSPSQLVHNLIQ